MRATILLVLSVFSLLVFAEESVSVSATPLKALLVYPEQQAPAQVINQKHALISARLQAEVASVVVKVGDAVSAGDLLLALNCDDYQLLREKADAQLSASKARVRLARQQLTRAEKLLKQQNAAREMRDQRRAELDSALADQDAAKVQLAESTLAVSRCQVKAPFSGVITEQQVSEGSLVNPGMPLFKLISIAGDSTEVTAKLSADQVQTLQQADQISFQDMSGRYPLQLRAIIPFVDNRARTQELRFNFPKQQALPGSSGRIHWRSAEGYIPVSYIVSREGVLGVMLLEQGKAKFYPLANTVEGQAAAATGIDSDSLVIISGHHAVIDGQNVHRVE